MIRGLDVSNNQGAINWLRVGASGIAFALCKASEGTGFPDPFLPENLAGAVAAGVAPAAYHFALPATSDPTPNAKWFLQCAERYLQDGMPVALDLEDDPYGHTIPDDLAPWALEWLIVVERALGIKPLIYTDLDIILNHGLNNAAFGEYGLWLAYPAATLPQLPQPWSFWAVWQNAWHGRVPGIAGDVDLDLFNGDVAGFRAYGTRQQPQPPPMPVFDDAAQWQLVKYVAGGSGPADLVNWLNPFVGASDGSLSATTELSTGRRTAATVTHRKPRIIPPRDEPVGNNADASTSSG